MTSMHDSGGSSWLRHFTSEASFFGVCPKCSGTHSQREATCNQYCVETGEELCSVCAHGHSGTIIQVRRSSYHDVVRAQDIAKLADISGVQAYTINGARVLFLRRRPQPRPPKGAVGASQCTICSRHLQDVSLYCSLQCKLDALCGGAPVCLRASSNYRQQQAQQQLQQQQQQQPRPLEQLPAGSDSSGSHGGPETPSHLTALRPLDAEASDSEGSMVEARGACRRREEAQQEVFCHSRRKGSPHRSPHA